MVGIIPTLLAPCHSMKVPVLHFTKYLAGGIWRS